MKGHSIVWLLVFLLAGCAPSIPKIELSEDHKNLSRNSEGQLLCDGKPFSGYLVSHYSSGVLRTSIPYYLGVQESVSLGYYPSGRLMYERPYKKGEKHGTHSGYYENGQPKFRYLFEKGLSIGNHQEWYESGQLASDLNYRKGQPFGPQKVWRPDGKIRSNYVMREDGRRYGLVGMKRCKNIDTENEQIAELKPEKYAQ